MSRQPLVITDKKVHDHPEEATYDGRYDLWQYTSAGTIEGIETRVDLNMCYKDF